jgi:DNA topoisomerase-3
MEAKMAVKLIIAEKPSVAKKIAEALGTPKFNKSVGYYEAGGWIVSFALGHIIGLAEPKEYDPKYQKWRKDTLPIIPQHFKYRILNRKRFSALKKLIGKADVIVNACDAGREGELIFREILLKAKPKKTAVIKRMWLSAMTKSAVQQEIKNLKPISKYDNLSVSAFSRAIADWLVGINATRAYTIKKGDLYTIGRVQTPTLKAIIDREKLRAQQKETYYYQIIGTFHSEEYQGTYFKDFDTEAQAKAVAKTIPNKGEIKDFKNQVVKIKPQMLYNLTTLQKDANKLYHFSAQKTLNIMQSLYEAKLLSYPRTDSRYIPKSIVSDVNKTIAVVAPLIGVKSYGKLFLEVVNDAKVTDHYAIIPTGETAGLNQLTPDQQKIYYLVVKRFVSVFLGYSEVQRQSWKTVNKQHVFNSSREAILNPGWQLVYGKKPEGKLSILQGIHDLIKTDIVKKKKGKTPPYTDASLLAFMEHAGKYGLGTSATRASIIERLIKTKYIQRKGNILVPKEKGYSLIESLSQLEPRLVSPELTALFEKGLQDIEKGKEKQESFLATIRIFTEDVTKKLLQ